MAFYTICDEEGCPRPVFGGARHCPPHCELNDTVGYGRCQAENCQEVTMAHEEFCPDHDPDVPSNESEDTDGTLTSEAGRTEER